MLIPFCVDITLCLLHQPSAIETKYLSKVFYCQATRARPGFNTNAQVDIHGRAAPRIAYIKTNLKKKPTQTSRLHLLEIERIEPISHLPSPEYRLPLLGKGAQRLIPILGLNDTFISLVLSHFTQGRSLNSEKSLF